MKVAHVQVAEPRFRPQVLEGRRILVGVLGEKVPERLVLFLHPVQAVHHQGQMDGVGVVNSAPPWVVGVVERKSEGSGKVLWGFRVLRGLFLRCKYAAAFV